MKTAKDILNENGNSNKEKNNKKNNNKKGSSQIGRASCRERV